MPFTNGSQFAREVRLGIVLYGGVSLAVYENGVAQELFRAIKGEGVYTLLKELIGSDIVVDIMSGTSAGGINGIFLGYALANDFDFKKCADLWRDQGDLMKLLRDPEHADDANSVLDSQGYYQPRLREAFEAMAQGTYRAAGLVSEINEMDVYVTGTNAHGRIYTEFDSEGHPIDVKDHRQVFQLSYRENRAGVRKQDFEPANADALAKLSRITSCFPVAFEPVQVGPGSASDEKILDWGRIKGESAHFLDGGLLNNKPFTLALHPIFHRTADREIERILFYVEPDPEKFVHPSKQTMPNVGEAAFDSLITIPGYQSIASDLQKIARHNDRVNRYQEIYRSVWAALPRAAGQALEPKVVDDVDGGLGAANSTAGAEDAPLPPYMQCRLSQLRDRAIDGLLKVGGRRERLLDGKLKEAEVLVDSFQNWKGDGYGTLEKYDVYYRLRRLYRLTYTISDILYGDSGKVHYNLGTRDYADQYRGLWARINHHIKLLESIQSAAEELIDKADIDWQQGVERQNAAGGDDKDTTKAAAEAWAKIEKLLDALLSMHCAGLTPAPAIDAALAEPFSEETASRQRQLLRAVLKDRVESLLKADGQSGTNATGNLLKECDDLEWKSLQDWSARLGTGVQNPVLLEYANFLTLDCRLFPLQYMSGMESTDVIRTVRISPIDGKHVYSKRSLDEKLCGRQLGHFGGFLKASWRANDILWGKLDGACQLIETLLHHDLAKGRVASVLAGPGPILADFPAEDVEEVRTAMKAVQEQPDDAATFDRLLEALIGAAQREIVRTELPKVIQAAIDQQKSWNQYAAHSDGASGGGNPAHPSSTNQPVFSADQTWSVGPRELDPAICDYAGEKMATDAEPAEGWVRYFESDRYRVGRERWNDSIPKPIVVEMVTTAALNMRNCLMKLAGKHADQIRSSLIYRAFVNWPLSLAYFFVKFQRTAPEYGGVAIGVIGAVCLTLLLTGAFDVLNGGSLFYSAAGTRWMFAIIWFGGPLGVLAMLTWYLEQMRTEWHLRRIVSAAAAVLVLLIGVYFVEFRLHNLIAELSERVAESFGSSLVAGTMSVAMLVMAGFGLSGRRIVARSAPRFRIVFGLICLVAGLGLGGITLTVNWRCPRRIIPASAPQSCCCQRGTKPMPTGLGAPAVGHSQPEVNRRGLEAIRQSGTNPM